MTLADKAAALTALHVPGDPLIVTNVWDAITARVVAGVPGVRAIATASHSVSFAHGVADGGELGIDRAIEAARMISSAVELPVSVDFEKGYASDAATLGDHVSRLIEAGAAGLNLEDSVGAADGPLFADAAARVAAARTAADAAGVPLAINARTDVLVGDPDDIAGAVDRGNAYLDAGATSVFVLRLGTERLVEQAVAGIRGPVAVIAGVGSPSLERLAGLGVARVSFGPGILGLTLAHLQAAAAALTARGEYPAELAFDAGAFDAKR